MAAVGAATTTVGRDHAAGPWPSRPRRTPPPPEDLERQKRTRSLIILLVVLLVALAVIAFFLLRSVGLFGGNVTVPNVVGQTSRAATQTLQNDHLTVGTSTVRDEQHDQGRRAVDRPQGGRVGLEELHGEPGGQRRAEHTDRQVPTVTGKQLDAGHRS